MCIFFFFNKNKQQSRNSDNRHHFSLTINQQNSLTFPDKINSLTFQVSGNPVMKNHWTATDATYGEPHKWLHFCYTCSWSSTL